jgi:hypothetical protein
MIQKLRLLAVEGIFAVEDIFVLNSYLSSRLPDTFNVFMIGVERVTLSKYSYLDSLHFVVLHAIVFVCAGMPQLAVGLQFIAFQVETPRPAVANMDSEIYSYHLLSSQGFRYMFFGLIDFEKSRSWASEDVLA